MVICLLVFRSFKQRDDVMVHVVDHATLGLSYLATRLHMFVGLQDVVVSRLGYGAESAMRLRFIRPQAMCLTVDVAV